MNGPGIPPARDMVKGSNAVYPFSSALTVLDIGCGPGQVSDELIKAYGAGLPASSRLVALDFSSGILKQLQDWKEEAISKGEAVWAKVEAMQCDATNLSAFLDNSVSHALAGFVIFSIPEADRALKEILRVLTDQNGGGVFAMSSWQGSEWAELMSFPSKVRPEKPVMNLPPKWSTVEGLRAELEVAGFRDVDVHTIETHMPFDDPEEISRFILTQFPLMTQATADMTSEELEKVLELMVEFIKSKHPSSPGHLDGTAIVAVGRK
jgi:SAM-dependent methyltransferase